MSNTLTALEQRLKEVDSPSDAPSIATHFSKTIEVTVAELVAAANKNPDHPVAKVYAAGMRLWVKNERLTDTHIVDVVDLQALLQNRAVKVNVAIVDGNQEITKELGDSLSVPANAAATPPTA
jgi:hypothetical protein